jgi:hypothetical protein
MDVVITSASNAFNVFPRGPIKSPTKFISGCSSCGIHTLSLSLMFGGLNLSKIKIVGVCLLITDNQLVVYNLDSISTMLESSHADVAPILDVFGFHACSIVFQWHHKPVRVMGS